MSRSSGFTLIELMIVVAVIAILAALAMPLYNDYTARAQLSEVIVLLSGLKTPIAEQFANDNSAASCAMPADVVTTGRYVTGITSASAIPCVITAIMKEEGVNVKVRGATVKITYTAATGIWDCRTSAPVEVAPKGCPHE